MENTPPGRRRFSVFLWIVAQRRLQFITLDQKERPRPDIARRWVHDLSVAIRQKDPRHLITVGLVDWSLDRKGLTSGFVPEKVAGDLDFVSVHLYPNELAAGHSTRSHCTPTTRWLQSRAKSGKNNRR